MRVAKLHFFNPSAFCNVVMSFNKLNRTFLITIDYAQLIAAINNV